MLDADLAAIYGVETRRLNEQVRRNPGRFPADFMFRLTVKEKDEVVANCDILPSVKFSRTTPFAFTEHGAVMLAAVLNSPRARARRERGSDSSPDMQLFGPLDRL